MSEPRFFVDDAISEETEIALHAHDAHHIAHVLRLAIGDPIVLLHEGVAWDATIARVDKDGVRTRVVGRRSEPQAELPLSVTILQAVIKGNKFDDVVEKCVELGAARIVPVICERSYAVASASKVDRWRRIARSAAQQSRRHVLPVIDDAMPWVDAIRDARPLIVAWEGAPFGSLAAALSAIGDSRSMSLAVGPEGSFTDAELDAARAVGAHFVSLGATILRTETAAAALLAAIASKRW